MLHGSDYEMEEVLLTLRGGFNRSARETVNALSAEAREAKLNRILGREARARASREVGVPDLDDLCSKFRHAFELFELDLASFNIPSGSLPLYQDRIRFLQSILEKYDDISQAAGKAYKKKARKYHPDKKGETELMQELNRIREVFVENKDSNKEQLRRQLEIQTLHTALDRLESKVAGLQDENRAVEVTYYCDGTMLYLIACYFPHLLRHDPTIHPDVSEHYAPTSLHKLSCAVRPVIVEKILVVSAGITSIVDGVGNTPLHSIIESGIQDISVSVEEIESIPLGGINYKINYKLYSKEVLNLIIQNYPKALLIENSSASTPLTLALRLANRGMPVSVLNGTIKNSTPALYVIEYMLSREGEFIAALEKHLKDIVRNESLLTLMISNEKGRELIKRNILSITPELLEARDDYQKLFALISQYEDLKTSILSINSAELRSHPLLLFARFAMGKGISEYVNSQDDSGRTLLHNTLAVKGVNIDYIIALYNAYPQALSIKDCNGNAPLHIAAMNNPKLVPLLLHWEPKVGFALNKEGKLPVNLLNREEASTEAQKLLNEYAKVTEIVALSMALGVMALGMASSIYLGIIFKLAEFVVMALCYLTMAVSIYSMVQAPTITEYCSGFFINLVSKPKVDDIDVTQAAL